MTPESRLTSLVARLAPWAAPVPTAYLVGRACAEYLAYPWPVAVVAAIVIECLGLSTAATALELYQYNRAKRKTDPTAPFVLAVVLVVLYAVVATGLTVALDILPQLRPYAPGIFPGLSLVGVTVLALRSDHAGRLAEIASERQRARIERAERKAEREPAKPTDEWRYVCGVCGKGFAQQREFAGHMSGHTRVKRNHNHAEEKVSE